MKRVNRNHLSIFRLGLVTMALVTLSGCYLKIITTEGGYVESQSSYRDCPSDQTCQVIVDTINFSETFTAVANPGYEFKGWAGGYGFICGNVTLNICEINLLYNSLLAGVVHSERTGYLMPIFEKLDVSPTVQRPTVVDANGDTVGWISDEYYGLYADIYIEPDTRIRFSFSSQYWASTMRDLVFFVGDECDHQSAFAPFYSLPLAGPATGVIVKNGDQDHIYRHFGSASSSQEVVVGSELVAGQCEDVSDMQMTLVPLAWMGTYDYALPLSRLGPPPCGIAPLPNCLLY